MQNIHKVVKVVNDQIIINPPSGFTDSEVEVILKPKPLTGKDTAILALEKK